MREKPRRLLRLKRDPLDRRRPERLAGSTAASVFLHALAALLLFSLPTLSMQQAAESISGTSVVSVVSAARPVPMHAPPVPTQVPSVAPQRPAAPPPPQHPRVLHELSKFAPTAPPNPTPPPIQATTPTPVQTPVPITVSPAPIPAPIPTVAPLTVAAVKMRVPPTAIPKSPQPSPSPIPSPKIVARVAPTAAPTMAPTIAPTIARTVAPTTEPSAAPHPAASAGPKALPSPGTQGSAPHKSVVAARPIQPLPATPPPSPAPRPTPHPARMHTASNLNQRLQSLIPNGTFTPEPPKSYDENPSVQVTPAPPPTPPPQVIAATQFLYEENVDAQRWKQSILGTAPEEGYLKMYVTSVRRVGPLRWCSGWVLRAPLAGSSKWIVEPNDSFLCAGRLQPFSAPPSGAP